MAPSTERTGYAPASRCSLLFQRAATDLLGGRGGDLDERGGLSGSRPGRWGRPSSRTPGLPEFLKATDTQGTTFEEALRQLDEAFRDVPKRPFGTRFRAIRSLRSVVDVMDEVGIEEYISRRAAPARSPSG
jgi:hypothetical protein